MHVAFFLDQHPRTLGGAQSSAMLQKKFLERAGHKVTIVAPHTPFGEQVDVVEYPSLALPGDPEFRYTLSVKKSMRAIKVALAKISEPIDLIHVQGDLWGAVFGYLLARELDIPVVHTTHTNIDFGAKKLLGGVGAVLGMMYLSRVLLAATGTKGKLATNGWGWLQLATAGADRVIAPSSHFAKLAAEHGVTAKFNTVPTGVDDDFISGPFSEGLKTQRAVGAPVRLLWCGRMSSEKRLMEFLEALELSGTKAFTRIYGTGGLEQRAKKFVAKGPLHDRVEFHGRVTHDEILNQIWQSDILVQTSVGFETQGMTVYEAGVLGTPCVLSDENIAADLPANSFWLAKDASVEALAEVITQAVADIEMGAGKVIDLRSTMLQSSLTEQILKLYAEAKAEHDR